MKNSNDIDYIYEKLSSLYPNYANKKPKAKIYVFAWIVIFVKLIKVPAFIVISIWIGLQFMNIFDQGSSGVAYSAHIGGFFTGLILTPFFKKNSTKKKDIAKQPHALGPDRTF